jgi:hypothetical protein
MGETIIGLVISFVAVLGVGMYVIVRKLNELHLSMNSRLDQLLDTTGRLARAEGFQAGQDDHLAALKEAGSNLEKKP